MANRKTVALDLRTERTEKITGIVKKGTERTIKTEAIKSQRSIRKNIRKIDPDQNKEITRTSDENAK
jgi:hypothetical protein